eukprot:CAMPEP_0197180040 /NCGR_PEP_ID=MMETSP1423-20130617/4797_1 /TAXON_ID=476441 /ORGANISM="Pseudo-nitzschia heimii, Strain UNC1101" /LENGTH=1643 /DNA_ID=CAMNT_0042630059 /DNA_START=214 /DNA_END=5145 /DNA_ORIENTATION=+
MLSISLPFLLLALFAAVSHASPTVGFKTDPSRIDILERRIESLEQLVRTQSEAIEKLLRRSLQADDASGADDGCLPKRNSDNVCVYEDDVEFFFQNASLVLNSSTVRFTGPILESNTTYCEGNVTNDLMACEGYTTNSTTAYGFSSRVVFESTDLLFQNASLVLNSSMVRFTGPILESNTTYCEGNVTTNLTGCEGNTTTMTTAYDFSSHVIFESTDLLVKNSNVTITAEHNYTSFETNKTNITQHFGFVSFNNTDVALNSSRFLATSPDPREVNRSLYDNITYANLFSSVGISFANIAIEDSNTTFTADSASGTDESSIVFNHTKISYNQTDVSFTGSTTSVLDSSVSYGRNTNVQWYGDSSSVFFTNGVEVNMDKSNVVLDDTPLELKGKEGRFVTRVESHVRGPSSGDPVDFVVSRRVNVRFEQSPTMVIESDVDFLDGSEITVEDGAALVIDGKLESNDESNFRGDINMGNVKLTVDGDLVIDGEDEDSNNAAIEFRRGVDVRFFNDLQLDRNLDVAGNTNLETLNVEEETTMRGRLYCRKGATISGDTSSVTSSTSMYSPELLRVEGSARVQRDLQVDGILTSGTHTFEGDVIVKGSAQASSLIVDSTARVYGTTTLGTLKASSGSITGQITAGSASFRDINVSRKATVSVMDATNATVDNELRARDAIVDLQLTSRTIKAESDIIFKNLDVSGTTTVRNLDVTGATKLYSLTVSGNANVGGRTTLGSLTGNSGSFTGLLTVGTMKADSSFSSDKLEVSGETTTGSLRVNSDTSIGGDLNVDGSTALDNTVFEDLTVLGTATINALSSSTATITDVATVQTLTLSGNANIEGHLLVGGTTDLASSSFDAIVVRGSASIGGDATVQTLTVNANANIVGDLSIEGSAELDNTVFRNLNVIGRGTFGSLSASSASISGDAAVQTLTVNANAKISGNLDVDGSTELADSMFEDVNVLGNIVVGGNSKMESLNVTSNAKIGGDLLVEGTTELDSTVFVDLTVLGTATVDSLSASSASVSNTVTMQRLSVDSNAYIGGNLNVAGSTDLATTVFQDISVAGTATVDSLSASSATISGAATLETITITADADIGGSLSVAGSMDFDDTTFQNINVLGRATMDSFTTSSAVISGAATIETLTVNSDADIGGDMAVGGSMELAVTVFQDISVLGTATIDTLSASSGMISGALTVDNDANIGGGLNVAGSMELDDTTFRNINVLGRATVDSLSASTASISAATTMQRLIVEADVEVGGDLNVDGAFAAAGKEASFNNVVVAGSAVVGIITATNSTLGELNVTGNTTVIGNLDVMGVFAPKNSRFSNIDVSGTATVGSLKATSSASMGEVTVQTLKVTDDADVSGDMNVGGSMELASTVFQELSVLGTASVGTLSAEFAEISGEATVQTLNVDADTAVTGSLSVGGSTSLENTIFQDISILGTADVDSLTVGTASIGGTATIGTLIVDNKAEIGAGLSVGGTFAPADSEFQDITVIGTASVGFLSATTASVSDTATIQTLSVGADADVSGVLSVGGTFAPDQSQFRDINVVGTATVGVLSASSAKIENTATIQTLSVDGNADISADLTIGGSFDSDVLVCQDINVSGTASVGSLLAITALVEDEAKIETLSVAGNADIAGDLIVAGTIGS